jgi:hypothetical protein
VDIGPDGERGGAWESAAPQVVSVAGVSPDVAAEERDDELATAPGASDAGAELAAPAGGQSPASLPVLAGLALVSGLGLVGLRLVARRLG